MIKILPPPIFRKKIQFLFRMCLSLFLRRRKESPGKRNWGIRILSILHPPGETAVRQKYISPDEECFMFFNNLYFRIISNLVETNMDSLSERFLLSAGSANRENHVLPGGPLPGQKSIRLAKKGGGPSFLNAGFGRFSPAISLPPRLFAETKRGGSGRYLPAHFGFGACFLARATRKRF
jgi:hypothetical protein